MTLLPRQEIEAVRARFDTEPGLRAGLWGVVLLVALQGLFMLGDARRDAGPEIQRLADRHARLEQVLAEADWTARAEAARAQREAIESDFLAAETLGLARAEFQGWLEQQIRKNGLELAALEMRPPVIFADLPGFQRIGATLQLEFDPHRLLRLLGALDDAAGWVSIDALTIDAGRGARMRLELHAIYRIAEEPGA